MHSLALNRGVLGPRRSDRGPGAARVAAKEGKTMAKMGELIHERNYTFTNRRGETFHVLLQMDEAKVQRAALHLAQRALDNQGMTAAAADGTLKVTVTKVLP